MAHITFGSCWLEDDLIDLGDIKGRTVLLHRFGSLCNNLFTVVHLSLGKKSRFQNLHAKKKHETNPWVSLLGEKYLEVDYILFGKIEVPKPREFAVYT